MILLLAGCSAAQAPAPPGMSLSEEPLLGKFVWHDLLSDDPEASKRFYGSLFGWTFEETRRPGGTGPYTLIRAGSRYLGGIVPVADPVGADYSRWLGYLSVADVDEAVQETRAAGGEAVAGPQDLGNVGRAAAVRDPQGAIVGLLRSRIGDPDDLPAGVGQIIWNELLAKDDAEAALFYAALAEVQPDRIERRGSEYIVLRSAGRDRAGIMERPSENVEPLWLTHFAVHDPTAAAQRAAELGGTILLAPQPDLRDGTMALITDPSGAILALRRWPL